MKFYIQSLAALIILTIILFTYKLTEANSGHFTEKLPGISAVIGSGFQETASPKATLEYQPWVDSVFQSLSIDERIAQLLMIRVHTDKDAAYYKQIERMITTYNVGGIAFFRGGPVRQAQLTNRLQRAVKTPMLVAMDAEWGPAMRLDSTIVFPRQMTLGALNSDTLIYDMGLEIGRQLARLGVHINFAPVVDVNNNPQNPVINFRSFGENRDIVSNKGIAYMNGLQDAGIIACAKHFPGHGDTDADSHHTLPLLNHTFEEIDSIHLYPFKTLINHGLHAVMVAHLEMPALESRKKTASTLSRAIVTDLLKHQLEFKGLIITDALDMRGVSDYFKSGELELQAMLAGNDILLLPEDVPAAIQAIKKAIDKDSLVENILNETCKKILSYKYFAGLNSWKEIATENLIEDLNPDYAKHINRQLARASMTIVRNEGGLLPIKNLDTKKMATLSIGAPSANFFANMVNNYADLSTFSIAKEHNAQQAGDIIHQLQDYELVIISVHNNSMFPSRQYGINQQTIGLIRSLAKNTQVILSVFANPYSLSFFNDDILDIDAIVVAWQDGQVYEEASAQVIFGGLSADGRLPVSAGKHFPSGTGYSLTGGYRIGFGYPEDVGIDASFLHAVDSIALNGIQHMAYPGCQIVLIKDGTVFYQKAFGQQTYGGKDVLITDLYDLASLTKIAATTPSVMHMSDKGQMNVDKTLGTYLPWMKGTDKGNIIIRELMAHQARLKSWIPFYLETLTDKNLNPFFFDNHSSAAFPFEVARNLYLHKDYKDSIFTKILLSPMERRRSYIYSDLGFILLAEVVNWQTGLSLDKYIDSIFYKPLGLKTMGYKPLRRFSPGRIIPTENDTIFRKQLIHGHVHDPAAAMLDGVSGHAGLFANALDVAVIMQVYLQKGYYAGKTYFDEATVREFTRVQYPGQKNRRGLGFDKPVLERSSNGPTTKSASPNSFGHSGFTGTYAWVDPEENLVYVFLSNRIYPTANNGKLSGMNIRTNIHEAVYSAIKNINKTVKIIN